MIQKPILRINFKNLEIDELGCKDNIVFINLGERSNEDALPQFIYCLCVELKVCITLL